MLKIYLLIVKNFGISGKKFYKKFLKLEEHNFVLLNFQRLLISKNISKLVPMKTGKLVKLNKTIYPLVEITLLKGEKTNITWGCLSALIETNILSAYSKILLKEENLYLYENIVDNNKTIEGKCFDI